MRIKLNELEIEVTEGISAGELRSVYRPDADIIVINGGLVGPEHKIAPTDKVVLIQRGKIPEAVELECMLTARHTPEVYEKLQKATVGIAGLGGLGSQTAVALVRTGIGELQGFDFDVVEPSNINRQYYFLDQIGMKKNEALAQTLNRISPLSRIELKDLKIDKNNIKDLFHNCDIIIEAFDNVFSKAMLFEAWHEYYRDKYYIGASGVAGYREDPPLIIRAIGDKGYMVGDFTTGAAVGTGLMAPRVGIASHMQANLAVKLLLEVKDDHSERTADRA